MEVTQRTWKTAADWQKNGNNAEPAQKIGTDELSVFGAGVQDIKQTSIEDILIKKPGVKTADTERSEEFISNLKKEAVPKIDLKAATTDPKSKNQYPFALMSEINKQLLSVNDLKKLAGQGGGASKAEVIENLQAMKDSFIKDSFQEIFKGKIPKDVLNGIDQTIVTESCSECCRDWDDCHQKGSRSSNIGTYNKNHKMYLLKPGIKKYQGKARNSANDKSIKWSDGGSFKFDYAKKILDYCNNPEQQMKLGTVSRINEALVSLGVKDANIGLRQK